TASTTSVSATSSRSTGRHPPFRSPAPPAPGPWRDRARLRNDQSRDDQHEDAGMQAGTSPRGRSRLSTRLLVALILGATALMAVSFFVGRASVPVPEFPGNTSAEAGFSRDMQTHHLQAVEMSLIVRDRTEDDAIRL